MLFFSVRGHRKKSEGSACPIRGRISLHSGNGSERRRLHTIRMASACPQESRCLTLSRRDGGVRGIARTDFVVGVRLH
jgi:hypothetical protein